MVDIFHVKLWINSEQKQLFRTLKKKKLPSNFKLMGKINGLSYNMKGKY